MKTIYAYNEPIDYEIPSNPVDFIDYLQTKIKESVPMEYIDSCKVELEALGDYDASSVFLSISYDRPMTRPEIEAEERNKLQTKQFIEKHELEELARLRAKYGGKND